MFEVDDTIRIPLEEFSWSFARSGGPGGQNVNKVESKTMLRWPMATSEHLDSWVKNRIRELYPSRVTDDGDLIITSQEYRDRERNKDACLAKLGELIRKAAERTPIRRPTRPTKGSKLRRMDAKKRESHRKANRKVQDE